MTDTWESHVQPHGPLRRLDDNLWILTGSLGRSPLPRNMVVWRMPGGGLFVHSAIAVDEATLPRLLDLGRPSILVVPNGIHRADAGVWKARFPDLRVVCPAAVRARVAEAVKVDATCEQALPPFGIGVHTPVGVKAGELAYELDLPAGRALVVSDLLFNLVEAPGGLGGFVLRHLADSVGPLKVSRVFKMLVMEDRAAYAKWLEHLAGEAPWKVLCVGHGAVVTEDVPGRLREASARIAG